MRLNPLKLAMLSMLMLALAACTNGIMPAPKSTAQAIYQLQGAYAAALTYEVGYDKLPRCQANMTQACSKTTVILAVKRASDVAWTSIKTAQNIVRTPGYGEDIAATAFASANQALNAYVEITNELK